MTQIADIRGHELWTTATTLMKRDRVNKRIQIVVTDFRLYSADPGWTECPVSLPQTRADHEPGQQASAQPWAGNIAELFNR